MGVIHVDHPAQNVAWRKGNRRALAVEGVMDHLKRPVRSPGRGGGGRHVGAQDHVALDKAAFAGCFAPITCDGLEKDGIGQVKVFLAREFRRWHRLAARDTGQI